MPSAAAMMAAAGGPVLNGADAAGLKEAAGMYEQLRAEWNRKNLNLSKCGDLLGRLKRFGEEELACLIEFLDHLDQQS